MATLNDMIDSEVFLAFSTYATIVIVKMLLMGPMTAYFRMTRKAFSNVEDAKMHSSSDEDRKKMVCVNPDVERIRRCHQNDMENIIPFVVIGLLYTLTGPDLSTALLYFRVFAGSRIAHTIAYVLALPQPSRGLCWIVGMVITFCMAYRILSAVLYL